MVKKRDYDAIRRERNDETREKDYLEIGGSRQEEPGRGQAQAQVVEAEAGDPDQGGAGGPGQGAEGEVHQGVAPAHQVPVQADGGGQGRQPVREGWSFQPPKNWSPPVRRQPTTRSVSARRERDKKKYQ